MKDRECKTICSYSYWLFQYSLKKLRSIDYFHLNVAEPTLFSLKFFYNYFQTNPGFS